MSARNRSKPPRVCGGMGLVTVHFEDRGQDFLQWTIAETGEVVRCEPFQAFTWTKAVVINVADLQVGVHPIYRFPGVERPLTLKYAIVAIHDAFDVVAEENAVKQAGARVVVVRPTPKPLKRSALRVARSASAKGGAR